MKKFLSKVNSVAALTILAALIAPCRITFAQTSFAQSSSKAAGPQKIILDTDIGDDIDDAFAWHVLASPRVQLLGVTTAWGNTNLRARLAERFLAQTRHSEIPVAAGPKTVASSVFTQAWPNAIDFILDAIRRNPDQITLISIAPLSNVGALIDRDPDTFRKLKPVVMGGFIRRGYGDLGYLPNRGPSPEYNIAMDIPATKKLFASGVPLYLMPLGYTQLKLDEVMRDTLFRQGTPSTDALALLYRQWTASTLNPTPTLYDAMAVAEVIDPGLCPTRPTRILIHDRGYIYAVSTLRAQVSSLTVHAQVLDFQLHPVFDQTKTIDIAADGSPSTLPSECVSHSKLL